MEDVLDLLTRISLDDDYGAARGCRGRVEVASGDTLPESVVNERCRSRRDCDDRLIGTKFIGQVADDLLGIGKRASFLLNASAGRLRDRGVVSLSIGKAR